MTTTVLNTKISEDENKILNDSKYITTQQFNKLTAEDFASRLKQTDLVNKTDFDNKLTSFNRQITSNKTKPLEVQKKINSLITKDYNFFSGRSYFTSNNGSQNTFFYQPTLDTFKLKKDKGIDYVLIWESKGVFYTKLKSLYTTFLSSIKFSEYRIRIKCDKDYLAVEQNNYFTKIVKVYIAYDLDAWTRNPSNLKTAYLEQQIIVKNSDKEKYLYSGYGIAFLLFLTLEF